MKRLIFVLAAALMVVLLIPAAVLPGRQIVGAGVAYGSPDWGPSVTVLSSFATSNPAGVTIAGSFQSELGAPFDWDPTAAETDLTYDAGDDVWQGVFNLPAGNWEYKATLNASWDDNYGANAQRNGPNIGLSLGAQTDVKFYYDHKSHWITDNQNSVIATVVGNFQSEMGCLGDWQPDCLRSWLQDADGDGLYGFSTAIPPGDYEAKVAHNETWDENYGAGGVPNGNNIPFTVAVGVMVDFVYDPASHFLTITPGNALPSLTVDEEIVTVNEGQLATNNGSVSDADGDSVWLAGSWGWLINRGDGTWSWSQIPSDGPGESQTVTIIGNDGNGGTCQTTFELTVNNVAPTIGPITAPADPVPVNSAISTSASFADPGILDTHLAVWEWGDGTTSAGVVMEIDGSGSVSGTHAYTAPGVCTITLTVIDKDGGQGTSTLTVSTVQPPTANAGGPYTVDEGSCVTLVGSGTDPQGLPLAYAWDLNGDGVFETPGQSVSFCGVDGSMSVPVELRVCNSAGLRATASTTVTIDNVAPTVGAITAPIDPVQVKTAINTSASFTDPGLLDTHSAVWDWGDGSTSAGTVNETNGSGSVAGSHTYTTPGVYTITLTVVDRDGGQGSAVFEFVVVYDPNGGFVTGGGWINSPPGAYPANPKLTGKAIFGFVSQYQKGATVPAGNTEFQFHAAGLNFHSTSYQWLVVAGAKAQYKGYGTINGGGKYGFLLTALDGQLRGGGGKDKLRIKIWDTTNGQIVYDNQKGAGDNVDPTTPIAGGSIVIHATKTATAGLSGDLRLTWVLAGLAGFFILAAGMFYYLTRRNFLLG